MKPLQHKKYGITSRPKCSSTFLNFSVPDPVGATLSTVPPPGGPTIREPSS